MSPAEGGASVPTSRARITVWGARGTCPSPGAHTTRYGGNTSCIDVQLVSGARVVLDAGTGLRLLGNSLSMTTHASSASDAPPTSVPLTIVLTHRHSDHVIGLSHFAPLITGRHRIRIACGGVDREVLRTLVQQQLSAPLFPNVDGVLEQVDVVGLEYGASLTIDGSCFVHAIAGSHPGGASVLRVDDAHGPLLAYAPDNELLGASNDTSLGGETTSWRCALAASLRGIPLLMHDATYSDDESARYTGWGHSSAEEATRFAMECDAQQLLLTHHHPERSDAAIDDMVRACRAMVTAAGSSLRVAGAAEGVSIDL